MKVLDRLWSGISERLFGDPRGPVVSDEDARKSAQATAPVIWLLGKTGAGKTAIVSTLTGDARAEVGAGFEPCTRTAAFYDVPTEVPLIRFLDTRGLDEVDYDPANLLLNGFDPVRGIIPLHRRIAHVHARDARKISVNRGAQEVALGAGDVDWLSFVGSLVSVEYRGWLTIRRETGQDRLKDIERGVAFLRRVLVPGG